MAKHVQGIAVANATSYKLYNYNSGIELKTQDTGGSIDFDLSTIDLAAGTYTLAVKAFDDTGTYATSEYSNTVSYTVESEEITYTFTITASPSSASITLTANGYTTVTGTGSAAITVASGTSVAYTVSASGYTTQSGTQTVTSTSSKSVTLAKAEVGEVTTFFTTGTKGVKRESPTINGFTWVMPKTFITSRVNTITVPVYLYLDEYDYVDICCEIFEPKAAGDTSAPTYKEGLRAVTRMTSDGDAVFNISFNASDIIADQCLIGVRALDGKKLAFLGTSGSSDWLTATANTGSSSADPCCTYYRTPSSLGWSPSNGVNTRYLELSTDKTADTVYTLNYSLSKAAYSLVRTSSQYSCLGGISSGADIYEGDVISLEGELMVALDEDTDTKAAFPMTVDSNKNFLISVVAEDGTFFTNGTASTSIDDLENGAIDFTGFCWVMPKEFITAPVSHVSVPTLQFKETDVPVALTCELLDSSLSLIGDKTTTETVSSATGGHDFALSFDRNDITEDWCYIAIYLTNDEIDSSKEFAFTKNSSSGEWYNIIKDKSTYPPYYKYGSNKNWTISSAANVRNLSLKTSI